MQAMTITAAAFLSLKVFSCNSQATVASHHIEAGPEIKKVSMLSPAELKGLDSLDINFQLRGHCYAFSSAANAKPSNGEAHSDNIAQPINQSFEVQGLFLTIKENEWVKIDDRYLGHKLYLVNTTDTAATFNAQDSRLNIIAEVLNDEGRWLPITYLPSSWCGNSYHDIVLGSNEYWSFDIPVFKGKIKTKLRYSLSDGDKPKIISNEINGFANPGQLDPKNIQGHKPNGIMDPYND